MQLHEPFADLLSPQELFDEYVKEWKPRFAIGQLVEGKITA